MGVSAHLASFMSAASFMGPLIAIELGIFLPELFWIVPNQTIYYEQTWEFNFSRISSHIKLGVVSEQNLNSCAIIVLWLAC